MRAPREEPDVAEPLRRINVVLPGLYAWIATVLEPSLARTVGLPARIVAGSALLALISGVTLGKSRPGLARLLALHGFVGLSVLVWLLLGEAVGPQRIDPVKAALGALGWLLFAFGWGASREPARVPEDDPRVVFGDPLQPRTRPSPIGAVILGIALLGAALPLTLAWRIMRPGHALFGQAVALLFAVRIVSAGAEIASRLGQWARVEPASKRLGHAALPLSIAAIALIGGAFAWFTGDPAGISP